MRKVQGVPQSQTAALPRHQDEEETDKSKQAQVRDIFVACWKISVLKQGPDFHFEISGLFEIRQFEITRVDCIFS